MEASRQRGFTLVETCVAIGIVALAASGFLFALASFAAYGAHQVAPRREGATILAQQVLRSAQDAWKYGSPGDAPSGKWVTAIPLAEPSGPPTTTPATVTASLSNITASSAHLLVEVLYTPDPDHGDTGRLSVQGTLWVEAPFPASRVDAPRLIAMPTGAP